MYIFIISIYRKLKSIIFLIMELLMRIAAKPLNRQKTKMNLPNYKLKGAYSKDEFTDIKSFKERVNDFIELVEKDNARRIRIDFTIEWKKG